MDISHDVHSLHLDTCSMEAEECGELSYLVRKYFLQVSKSERHNNDNHKHVIKTNFYEYYSFDIAFVDLLMISMSNEYPCVIHVCGDSPILKTIFSDVDRKPFIQQQRRKQGIRW